MIVRWATLGVAMLLGGLVGCSSSTSLDGSDPDVPDLPGPVSATSCQQSFHPDRVAAGEDCSPVAGTYCPSVHYSGEPNPRGDMILCNGVTVSEQTISAEGIDSRYLAIRPATGSVEAIYLNLHYLGASVETNANQVRLNELAKSRHVLVIEPQAPGFASTLLLPGTDLITLTNPLLPELTGDALLPLPGTIGTTVPRWPASYEFDPVDTFVAFLDAVVADARAKYGAANLPLYVSGLSNGAIMAYYYACKSTAGVDGVLATGATLPVAAVNDCPAVSAVIVHGTSDVMEPYIGTILNDGPKQIYTSFKAKAGCTAADEVATIQGDQVPDGQGSDDPLPVTFEYTGPCPSGHQVFLVSVIGGGHNWPSQDNGLLGLDLNVFGLISRNWDATIYGYDLLKAAAGN